MSVRRVLLSLVVSVTLASCGGPPVAEKPPTGAAQEGPGAVLFSPLERTPEVRVLILEGTKGVKLSTRADLLLMEGIGGTALQRIDSGGSYTVEGGGDEVSLRGDGGISHRSPQLFLKPATDERIYINGKPYRGGFLFLPSHGSVVTINVIAVDDYIKGVLPAEIGYLAAAQQEAYRAQAIASRSYALSKLAEKEGELYDLKATIMDQVYRGVQGEHAAASQAVDETRGLVALWNGEPVRAYYSSCCGGHSADIRIGWPWKAPYPYLEGVRDAVEETKGRSLCSHSKHFRWRVHWSGGTLQRIVRKRLPELLGINPSAVGELRDITVVGTAPDGRVQGIDIETDRGRYRVDGDRIRWVLRPSLDSDEILKSTLFKMSVTKVRGRVESVNLVGGGNGHGIGMCQTGAVRMAELGYTAEEILRHYYPGITIRGYYR